MPTGLSSFMAASVSGALVVRPPFEFLTRVLQEVASVQDSLGGVYRPETLEVDVLGEYRAKQPAYVGLGLLRHAIRQLKPDVRKFLYPLGLGSERLGESGYRRLAPVFDRLGRRRAAL